MVHKNKINIKMIKEKSGQIQVSFNWLYVLIAGAVILLFFVGVVAKQKDVSEKGLSVDVLDTMESIFTGASVSDKSQFPINTGGIRDYTFNFRCSDLVNEYGFFDKGVIKQENLVPIFSPMEIKTEKLFLWSVPYNLPYHIINLLIVTSENSKYYLLGDLDSSLTLLNDTKALNIDHLSYDEYANGGIKSEENYQVRIVDFEGRISSGESVPTELHNLADDKVTMVSFLPSPGNSANYYSMKSQEENKVWEKISEEGIKIISLGEDPDAAKYAAIFAANSEEYRCAMQKVFRRMKHVTELYQRKLNEIEVFHGEPPVDDQCITVLEKKYDEKDPEALLGLIKGNAAGCEGTYAKSMAGCLELLQQTKLIKEFNQNLETKDCINLY